MANPKPNELIVTGNNLLENWKKFKNDFLEYLSAQNIEPNEQDKKISIFTDCVGENGLNILKTLIVQEQSYTDLDSIMGSIETLCSLSDFISKRAAFYTKLQNDDESFDEYLETLGHLARSCLFGNQEESEIKQRIFFGLFDKEIRDELKKFENSSLDDVIGFCRAAELCKNEMNVDSSNLKVDCSKSTEFIVGSSKLNIESEKKDTRNLCGFTGWHPAWLQKLANPKVFLVIYGFLGTTQSIKSIYFTVTLTTLERRFKIPSETTGILMTGNEISQILLSLILSYAGGGKNRPRWISWGVAICGLSCFVLVLPHVFYGAGEDALQYTKEYYEHLDEGSEFLNHTTTPKMKDSNKLCSPINLEDDCLEPISIFPLVLIFLSQFVLGIGNTLYYALGHSYLDDSIKRTKTAMMLAIAASLRFSGSAVGFGLGYFSLNLFVDPTKTPLISSNDPRWLGAWWFGWIVIGCGMLFFAIFIGMFPKEMPKKRNREEIEVTTEKPQEKLNVKRKMEKPKMKDFPAAVKRILKNKLLIYNILSSIFFILGASVYMVFLSKYMEVQFNQSKANATIISGPMKIIGVVSGFLLSGYIITKYRPSPRKIFFWNVLVGCSYMVSQFIYLFLFCSNGNIVNSTGIMNLTNSCNSGCFCDNVPYSPVCHRESNITFFSACHAGCMDYDRKNRTYMQCNCIDKGTVRKEDLKNDVPDVLYPGLCSIGCKSAFMTFNVIILIKSILGGSSKIGNILLNLRVVTRQDKSIAQGMALMLLSLFAFIPAPILYGRIIDSTCLVWSFKCGQQGYCQLYDQTAFRYKINLTALGLTFLGVIFDALVWYYGKNVNLYDEEDEEEEKKKNTVDEKIENTKM